MMVGVVLKCSLYLVNPAVQDSGYFQDSGWVFGVDAASDDVSDFEEGAEVRISVRG